MPGYVRLFAIHILLAVIALAVMAGFSLRRSATDQVIHLIEQHNASLAQGYANIVWKKHHDAIAPLLASDAAGLQSSPAGAQFAEDSLHYFQQMPLVRANIYSASGALLLTINTGGADRLVGSAVSPDAAFVAAHIQGGEITSHLLPDVAVQTEPHAALVQSVAPIRTSAADILAGKAPEGAVEIISDMTSLKDELERFQFYLTGGIIGASVILMTMMGTALFTSSRRAEAIIARQHETNLDLQTAVAEAQAENRDKSQFLANVSHELRTPLNAIIGFSDVIKNEIMPKISDQKYHGYINDIHAAGVHLLSLINDILDYSKAEAGKLELEASEVNATKLIQGCLRLMAPRAESGKVKLEETLPREEIVLVTDSKKFKQILLNLLSNAVKFTPAGGKVSVTGWHNLAEDTFSFEVKDTGIGIAPKDISRAMSPFGQVDNSLKRKYEGTGLGLPLTKKFVELMDGTFTIESEPNVGTTIVFTLPRQIKERDGVV
ncbi:MAG: HAMP domain-containing histidine kinase, partial [Pseudomonadota bacterium]|nr:HAMP domain-containing histidine kinase [Pseudomonadota bacterium]